MLSVKERIERMSIPEPNSGCWLWLGALKSDSGYGNMIIGSRKDGTRKSVSAHRASFEAHFQKVGSDAEVCHRCDNPFCVNPDHLFEGTRLINVADMISKGRSAPQVGQKNANSVISEETAQTIINLLSAGVGPSKISRSHGISLHICKDISRGRRWKHLLPEPPK